MHTITIVMNHIWAEDEEHALEQMEEMLKSGEFTPKIEVVPVCKTCGFTCKKININGHCKKCE